MARCGDFKLLDDEYRDAENSFPGYHDISMIDSEVPPVAVEIQAKAEEVEAKVEEIEAKAEVIEPSKYGLNIRDMH